MKNLPPEFELNYSGSRINVIVGIKTAYEDHQVYYDIPLFNCQLNH